MRGSVVVFLSAALLSSEVLTNVAKHADRFGVISRQIWETPELGFHETTSSALLQKELRLHGFQVTAGVAGMPTAFTASWGSGKPVIVLLGEFDALPGRAQLDPQPCQP
jgi:aminobenzoyl-glutamate utilization protein B